MNFQALQRSVRHARMARNILAGTTALLFGINGLLAFEIYSQSNQVILVPTNVSDGMIARGAVDKRYLEALALDAVYGLYNANPQNLDYGRTVIARLAAVADRNALLRHYDSVATDIRERKISTVFFARRIEHNFDRLEVIVEGDMQTFLNTVLVGSEPRRIKLSFVVEAGSTRLSRISKLEIEG